MILLWENRNFKTLFALAASIAGALVLSCFYWLKVITEIGFLAKDKIYPETAYNFHINFLLTPFDAEIRDLYFTNALLLAVLIIVVPLVIAYLYQSKKQNLKPKNYYAVLFIFIFSVLMTTRFSQPLWEYLPLLKETQFPWRWLGVISICGAVLSGAAIPKIKDFVTQKKRPFALVLTGMIFISLAFTGGQVLRSAMFIEADFDDWQKAQVEQQGVVWWWTSWARIGFAGEYQKISIPGRNAQMDSWSAEERKITVSKGEIASTLRISTFYYPYWKAQINGKDAEVSVDENGAILLNVPAEESEVELKFEEPVYKKSAMCISLFSWFVIISLMIFLFFKDVQTPTNKWKN